LFFGLFKVLELHPWQMASDYGQNPPFAIMSAACPLRKVQLEKDEGGISAMQVPPTYSDGFNTQV
jgi:hypothetical protein